MGLFDFFRKKQPHYDATNIQVHDLGVGFVFEYDLKTWIVEALYEYDWGDNYFTREFRINTGEETAFLTIEEDDELRLTLSKKIKVRAIDQDLPEYIVSHEAPPKRVVYQGKTFLLEGENPGYFHDIAKGDQWEELISWDYEDNEGKYVLGIEQWGEKEFEASHGKIIQEFEISNILPGEEK